jgi:hypothetical protein
MYVKANSEMVYIWRTVDHEGEIFKTHEARPSSTSGSFWRAKALHFRDLRAMHTKVRIYFVRSVRLLTTDVIKLMVVGNMLQR